MQLETSVPFARGIAGLIAFAFLCAGCSGNNASMTAGIPKPAPASMAFTMTNATSGNVVQAYLRASDGTLIDFESLPTGGTGVGHGLENQGALALSRDGRFLYVVNPGSNDVTVFQITDKNVKLTDRAPSGGTLPVSVAEWNGIVYVLNRNGSNGPGSGPMIQGFQVSPSGILRPIVGSALALRATNTNAAQIAISPDGLWIVVTERGISQIDVVPLDQNHVPGTPRSAPSAGGGPFGFAFSDAARLYVSEAGAGTTSAYEVDSQGMLRVLSAAVPTQQRATCWLAIAPDNDLMYVSNTASGSISSYRIAQDGTLTRLISVAATTAGNPLDVIVSADGDYLSVLTTDGSIETFRIDVTSGSLSSIQMVSGLPSGTNGLTGQ
jgi:6-phosphogluconolactonase (cycloisomerase 2 family)